MTAKEIMDALARKSGGGVNPSETIGTQRVQGIALFLEDGRVAFVSMGGGEQ